MDEQQSQADCGKGRLTRLARRLADQDPSAMLPRRLRLAMTVGPIVGLAVMLLAAYLYAGWVAAGFVAWIELGSFIGLGKFVIFLGVPSGVPVGVWPLAGVVIYGDVGTCLIMLANMNALYRVPWLGERLARAHEAGRQVLSAQPWMRRMAWIGVAIFIAVPFQGTGAVVGTLMGGILGMSLLSILSAVTIGSAAGCAGLAALSGSLRSNVEVFVNNPVVSAICVVATLVLLVILGRWFMGHPRRSAEPPAPDPDDKAK
jgi:uncharacterized membrane protein